MTSRRTGEDWLIVILGALVLAVLLFLVWSETVKPEFGGTIILALTAWVILWYTVETMRLRREAEARARRDREPQIYFEVQQPTRMPTPSGEKHRGGFIFQNHSSNAGFARVGLQLSTAAGPAILISNAGYNGGQIWEVTPFFQIRGVFDLQDFAGFQPSGDMVLNVQVDLYGMDRRYMATLKREYHIGMPQGFEEFWPEVATSLPVLPHSHVC
jgi:hypothetical protein